MGFTLYGVLAALAMAAMLAVTGLASRRRSVGYTAFIAFAAAAIPLAFLCSRLVYCLGSISYYTETIAQPIKMLQVRDGGYSMVGAILGILIAALAVLAVAPKGKRGALLDSLALGMPVGLIIARLAEPLCDMGRHDIGWGYDYTSPAFSFLDKLTSAAEDFTGLHPVFAYEAIAALAILIVLLLLSRRVQGGNLLLSFLLLYGCSQTVMESLLISGHMKVIHFVKINQVAALVLAVIPLVIWSVRLAKTRPGSALRILTAWVLAIVCILSGVVQEFSVEGQDNPYFSVVLVGAAMAALLDAATLLWCIAWHREGLRRLLPVAVVSLIAIAAAIVDRTIDVGDSYRIVLWGIMACDMLLMCLTGFALRKAAEFNEQ